MSKRVLWRKGMRLTDDILRMSDECTDRMLTKALLLGASGRFGLLPGIRPFNISVDIDGEVAEVTSLSCLGITRDGSLIDVDWDSNYTNTFDARAVIPHGRSDARYILCLVVTGEWADTNDGLRQPLLSFTLIEENSSVPDNMLPIARLVFAEHCWRTDDQDFMPPCLFLSSSSKYVELCSTFRDILSGMDTILPQKFITPTKDAMKIMWPTVQQLMITVDKEADTMTPMQLLANVQKFISSFVCACTLDDYINIGDPEPFANFTRAACNYRTVYQKIRDGLELCLSVKTKVGNFGGARPAEAPKAAPVAAPAVVAMPTISKSQLRQKVESGNVKVRITNNAPGSTIYYTTDGSTPNQYSQPGDTVIIETGFTPPTWRREPALNVTVNAIAVLNGVSSDIATYKVCIEKGSAFNGKSI